MSTFIGLEINKEAKETKKELTEFEQQVIINFDYMHVQMAV